MGPVAKHHRPVGSIDASTALRLNGFGVAYNDRVVISDATLVLSGSAPLCLYGPMGGGKSTLLRAISGFRKSIPSMRVWGECQLRGRPLGATHHASLVAQNAKLLIATVEDNLLAGKARAADLPEAARRRLFHGIIGECGLDWAAERHASSVAALPLARQRELALWRTALANPPLLAIDEPTAGLDEADRRQILDTIIRINRRTPVIVATHMRNDAVDLQASLCVIDEGVVRNVAMGPDFARETRYVKLDRAPARGATPNAPTSLRYTAPPGFIWVLRGQLAGCRRPGLLGDVDKELEALRGLGIRTLIGLEEKVAIPAELLESHRLRYLHFPMPDMEAPVMEEMDQIMGYILKCIHDREPVAVHCRAGLGRTGTILAAALMAIEGLDPVRALERIRTLEPLFVQSAAQVEFLHRWAASMKA